MTTIDLASCAAAIPDRKNFEIARKTGNELIMQVKGGPNGGVHS